jgi:nitrate reductase NapAB chaperone NapD
MTPERMAEYFAAIEKAGVTPEEMGKLLVMLKAYSLRMIAEAQAAIADAQGQAAVQLAESARQKAQGEASAAQAAYLEVIKSLANGG